MDKDKREKAIKYIIEGDMDQLYKPRDIYMAFYEGIAPYKNLSDEEIKEYFEELDLKIEDIIN